MTLVLATGNWDKINELKELLSDTDIEIISQREAGFSGDVEETGCTFMENALLKAYACAEATGLISLADDSGICIDALNGAPGIFSARFGGGGLSHQEKNRRLLSMIPENADRSAQFVCAIACVIPGGKLITTEGICHGKIALSPSGSNGFGFDPIFYVPSYGCTMADLPEKVKNSISHRGKALANFKIRFNEYLRSKGI